MEFLLDVMSVHVPWDTLAVRPGGFHLCSRLHPTQPWIKVALICGQYFAPKTRCVDGPHGKKLGALLGKKDFERLARANHDALLPLEDFLRGCYASYRVVHGVPEDVIVRELPTLFARAARAVLLCKDLESEPIDMEKMERKLRAALRMQSAKLPDPVTACERTDDPEGNTRSSSI